MRRLGSFSNSSSPSAAAAGSSSSASLMSPQRTPVQLCKHSSALPMMFWDREHVRVPRLLTIRQERDKATFRKCLCMCCHVELKKVEQIGFEALRVLPGGRNRRCKQQSNTEAGAAGIVFAVLGRGKGETYTSEYKVYSKQSVATRQKHHCGCQVSKQFKCCGAGFEFKPSFNTFPAVLLSCCIPILLLWVYTVAVAGNSVPCSDGQNNTTHWPVTV